MLLHYVESKWKNLLVLPYDLKTNFQKMNEQIIARWNLPQPLGSVLPTSPVIKQKKSAPIVSQMLTAQMINEVI